jgi:outer membrane protein TolC
MRSAANNIRSAALSHDELMTSKLPQIRLNATSIFAPSSHSFGYDPVLSNIGELAGQFMVQQSLYDGGIRTLRSDQINVDLERTEKERRLADRDLTFTVKQAFVEVLRSEREMHLQSESVLQLHDYLEIVRQLARGGNASSTDVLKTELQLSNAGLAFQKASETFASAKYSLAEVLGGSIDTSFAVTGDLDDTLNAPRSPSQLSLVIDPASNLELSIASLNIRRTMMDVELTRHESFPTVSFVGDAGVMMSGENLRLPSDERQSFIGFSVGIVVEIPLLNWGATDFRIQQRQLATENLRLDSESMQRSLMSELKKAQLQLSKLRERLHSLRANRKSAEDIYALTKSKFVGGGTLSLEVLAAQQLLTETKLAELQSSADIQVLTAKIEQLTMR